MGLGGWEASNNWLWRTVYIYFLSEKDRLITLSLSREAVGLSAKMFFSPIFSSLATVYLPFKASFYFTRAKKIRFAVFLVGEIGRVIFKNQGMNAAQVFLVFQPLSLESSGSLKAKKIIRTFLSSLNDLSKISYRTTRRQSLEFNSKLFSIN